MIATLELKQSQVLQIVVEHFKTQYSLEIDPGQIKTIPHGFTGEPGGLKIEIPLSAMGKPMPVPEEFVVRKPGACIPSVTPIEVKKPVCTIPDITETKDKAIWRNIENLALQIYFKNTEPSDPVLRWQDCLIRAYSIETRTSTEEARGFVMAAWRNGKIEKTPPDVDVAPLKTSVTATSATFWHNIQTGAIGRFRLLGEVQYPALSWVRCLEEALQAQSPTSPEMAYSVIRKAIEERKLLPVAPAESETSS